MLYLWGNCWQASNVCRVALAVIQSTVNAKLLAFCLESNK